MIEQGATWVLFAVSVIGLWVSGSSPKIGWWLALINQLALWLPYAAWTQQSGLVATSLVFAALYSRNLWRWRDTSMPRPDRRPRPLPNRQPMSVGTAQQFTTTADPSKAA